MQPDLTQNRLIGSFIGLACGDAVGTTLEFKSPGSFEPITDMVGGGPFNLKASLWCFATTDSFEQSILKAANLADDADTTAAICGQIAGAFYGQEAIPKHWRERLTDYEMLHELAEGLAGGSIGLCLS